MRSSKGIFFNFEEQQTSKSGSKIMLICTALQLTSHLLYTVRYRPNIESQTFKTNINCSLLQAQDFVLFGPVSNHCRQQGTKWQTGRTKCFYGPWLLLPATGLDSAILHRRKRSGLRKPYFICFCQQKRQ